jgi:hypothetical protein
MNIISNDLFKSTSHGNLVEQVIGRYTINALTNSELDKLNIYYISDDINDAINDLGPIIDRVSFISSKGYRNKDKLSHEQLLKILEEIDGNPLNTLVIIKDYLKSVSVYDKGDKRFISQMHSLRKFNANILVGYDIDNYISLTDGNINISYHKNNSEKAKQLHRDLRNKNVSHILHNEEKQDFVSYDERTYGGAPSITTDQDWEILNEVILHNLILSASVNFIEYDIDGQSVTLDISDYKDSNRFKEGLFTKDHYGRVKEGVSTFYNLSVKTFIKAYLYSELKESNKSQIHRLSETRFNGYYSKLNLLMDYFNNGPSSKVNLLLGTEFIELAKLLEFSKIHCNMEFKEALINISRSLWNEEFTKVGLI